MTPDPKPETLAAFHAKLKAANRSGFGGASVGIVAGCLGEAIAETTPKPAAPDIRPTKSHDSVAYVIAPADPDAAAREVLCREMPVGATWKLGGDLRTIVAKTGGRITVIDGDHYTVFIGADEFRNSYSTPFNTDIRLPVAPAPSAPAPQPTPQSGAGADGGEVVRVWEGSQYWNCGCINVEVRGQTETHFLEAGRWETGGSEVKDCEREGIPVTDPARVAEVKASYAAWRAGQTAKPSAVDSPPDVKAASAEGAAGVPAGGALWERPMLCPFCGAVPEWDGEVVSCPTGACPGGEGAHIERWNRRAPSSQLAAELLRVNTENVRLAKEVERVTGERDEAKAVLDKPTTMVEHETVGYRAAVRLLDEARAESTDLRAKLAEAEKKVAVAEAFGLKFGPMKEAGKEPYMAFEPREGSTLGKLCDAETRLITAEIDRDRHARGEAELLTLLTDIRNTNSYWKRELDDDVCKRIADAVAVLLADPAAPPEATGPKACPFCGKTPDVHYASGMWEVVCRRLLEVCPMRTVAASGTTKEDAIAAWNRRAPSPKVAADLLRVNTENLRLAKEVERVTGERDELSGMRNLLWSYYEETHNATGMGYPAHKCEDITPNRDEVMAWIKSAAAARAEATQLREQLTVALVALAVEEKTKADVQRSYEKILNSVCTALGLPADADHDQMIVAIDGYRTIVPSDRDRLAARVAEMEGGVLGRIAAERQKQIAKSWTPEHDDEHAGGELALNAAFAALIGSKWCVKKSEWGELTPDAVFDCAKKDRGQIHNLIVAAAFLVAEIERIERTAVPAAATTSCPKCGVGPVTVPCELCGPGGLAAVPAAVPVSAGVEGVRVFEDAHFYYLYTENGEHRARAKNSMRWSTGTRHTADEHAKRYPKDHELSNAEVAALLAADPLPPAAVPAEVLTESPLPAPRADGAGEVGK